MAPAGSGSRAKQITDVSGSEPSLTAWTYGLDQMDLWNGRAQHLSVPILSVELKETVPHSHDTNVARLASGKQVKYRNKQWVLTQP